MMSRRISARTGGEPAMITAANSNVAVNGAPQATASAVPMKGANEK